MLRKEMRVLWCRLSRSIPKADEEQEGVTVPDLARHQTEAGGDLFCLTFGLCTRCKLQVPCRHFDAVSWQRKSLVHRSGDALHLARTTFKLNDLQIVDTALCPRIRL